MKKFTIVRLIGFRCCTGVNTHRRIRSMTKTLTVTVLGALLSIGAVALAQAPARNVSAGRHPNLAAAQRLSQQAFEKITAAQQANEFDMEGHAAKAKQLLEEANNELRAAATAANKNKK